MDEISFTTNGAGNVVGNVSDYRPVGQYTGFAGIAGSGAAGIAGRIAFIGLFIGCAHKGPQRQRNKDAPDNQFRD